MHILLSILKQDPIQTSLNFIYNYEILIRITSNFLHHSVVDLVNSINSWAQLNLYRNKPFLSNVLEAAVVEQIL